MAVAGLNFGVVFEGENSSLDRALAGSRRQFDKFTGSAEKASKLTRKQKKDIASVSRQWLGLVRQVDPAARKQIAYSKAQMVANRAIKELGVSTAESKRILKAYQKELKKGERSWRDYAKAVSIAGAATAAAAVARQAVSTYANLAEAVAELGAKSRASAEDMERMTSQARALGGSTAFTATQVTALQIELAQAGFEVNEVLGATPGVVNLALAGKLELARAAEIAANTIRQFNLDAADTTHVVNVMAEATAKSPQTLTQMGGALSYAGGVAKDAGQDIESAAAALAILAERGLKGERGGTGLRNVIGMLVDLPNASGKARGAIEGLGLSFEELDPRTRPIEEIFARLREAGFDLSDALAVAGKENSQALNALVQNAGRVGVLAEEFREVGNAGEEMANAMADHLIGDTRALLSAVEELMITGTEPAAQSLRDLVQELTRLAQSDEAKARVRELGQALDAVTRAVGFMIERLHEAGASGSAPYWEMAKALAQVTAAIAGLLGGLIKAADRLEVLDGIVAALISYKIAAWLSGIGLGAAKAVPGVVALQSSLATLTPVLTAIALASVTASRWIDNFRDRQQGAIDEATLFTREMESLRSEIAILLDTGSESQLEKQIADLVSRQEALAETTGEVEASFERAQEQVGQFSKALKDAEEAEVNATSETAAAVALRDVLKATKHLTDAENDLEKARRARSDATTASKEYENQLVALRSRLKELKEGTDDAGDGLGDLGGAGEGAAGELSDLEKKIQDVYEALSRRSAAEDRLRDIGLEGKRLADTLAELEGFDLSEIDDRQLIQLAAAMEQLRQSTPLRVEVVIDGLREEQAKVEAMEEAVTRLGVDVRDVEQVMSILSRVDAFSDDDVRRAEQFAAATREAREEAERFRLEQRIGVDTEDAERYAAALIDLIQNGQLARRAQIELTSATSASGDALRRARIESEILHQAYEELHAAGGPITPADLERTADLLQNLDNIKDRIEVLRGFATGELQLVNTPVFGGLQVPVSLVADGEGLESELVDAGESASNDIAQRLVADLTRAGLEGGDAMAEALDRALMGVVDQVIEALATEAVAALAGASANVQTGNGQNGGGGGNLLGSLFGSGSGGFFSGGASALTYATAFAGLTYLMFQYGKSERRKYEAAQFDTTFGTQGVGPGAFGPENLGYGTFAYNLRPASHQGLRSPLEIEQFNRLSDGFGILMRSVLAQIGGIVNELPSAVVQIQNSGEKFRVKIAGEVVRSFESMEEAQNFAIVEAIRRASFSEVGEATARALERSTAQTVEELLADVQFARDYFDEYGLSDGARAGAQTWRELTAQIADAEERARRLGFAEQEVATIRAKAIAQQTDAYNQQLDAILGIDSSVQTVLNLRDNILKFNEELAESEMRRLDALAERERRRQDQRDNPPPDDVGGPGGDGTLGRDNFYQLSTSLATMVQSADLASFATERVSVQTLERARIDLIAELQVAKTAKGVGALGGAAGVAGNQADRMTQILADAGVAAGVAADGADRVASAFDGSDRAAASMTQSLGALVSAAANLEDGATSTMESIEVGIGRLDDGAHKARASLEAIEGVDLSRVELAVQSVSDRLEFGLLSSLHQVVGTQVGSTRLQELAVRMQLLRWQLEFQELKKLNTLRRAEIAWIEALINEATSKLKSGAITPPDFSIPAPSSPSYSGPSSTGGSESLPDPESVAERIEALRRELAKMPQTVTDVLDRMEDLRALIADMEALGEAEAKLYEIRKLGIDVAKQNILADDQALIDAKGQTDFQQSVQTLFGAYEDKFKALFHLAAEEAKLVVAQDPSQDFDTVLDQIFHQSKGVADQGFAIQLGDLLDDALSSLADAGDIEGIQALKDEFFALLALDLPQGVKEALEGFLATTDAFGTAHQEALETVRQTFGDEMAALAHDAALATGAAGPANEKLEALADRIEKMKEKAALAYGPMDKVTGKMAEIAKFESDLKFDIGIDTLSQVSSLLQQYGVVLPGVAEQQASVNFQMARAQIAALELAGVFEILADRGYDLDANAIYALIDQAEANAAAGIGQVNGLSDAVTGLGDAAASASSDLDGLRREIEDFISAGARSELSGRFEQQQYDLDQRFADLVSRAREAGWAVADLTRSYEQQTRAIREAASERLRQLRARILEGDPTVTSGARIEDVYADFLDAVRAARSGDLDARDRAAELGDVLLGLYGQQFAGSSQARSRRVQELLGLIDSIPGVTSDPVASRVDVTNDLLRELIDVTRGDEVNNQLLAYAATGSGSVVTTSPTGPIASATMVLPDAPLRNLVDRVVDTSLRAMRASDVRPADYAPRDLAQVPGGSGIPLAPPLPSRDGVEATQAIERSAKSMDAVARRVGNLTDVLIREDRGRQRGGRGGNRS